MAHELRDHLPWHSKVVRPRGIGSPEREPRRAGESERFAGWKDCRPQNVVWRDGFARPGRKHEIVWPGAFGTFAPFFQKNPCGWRQGNASESCGRLGRIEPALVDLCSAKTQAATVSSR